MTRLILLCSLFIAGFYLATKEDDCWRMKEGWKTEKEAIFQIEKTSFRSSDSLRPDRESWMTSAHYYQCNDELGYLIVKTDKKTMIHQQVPIAIWDHLKEAKPKSGYYNFYIKNKFKLDKINCDSSI